MIAINLAAAAVEIDLTPVIIDRDSQGTTTLYHDEGKLPFKVLPDHPISLKDIDLVIIDHAANDPIPPPASLVLMPVMPKRSQYAAYIDSWNTLKAMDKRIITIVTNGDMRREQERVVVISLKQRGAFEVRASGVFSRADNDYLTIFDSALNNAYGIRDRRQEFRSILAAVLQEEENDD